MIGGPVIRDPALGSLAGRWITGDFCTNGSARSTLPADCITDPRPLGAYLPPGKGKSAFINGFGEDAMRRVYVFSNFGGVYRSRPPPDRSAPSGQSDKPHEETN